MWPRWRISSSSRTKLVRPGLQMSQMTSASLYQAKSSQKRAPNKGRVSAKSGLEAELPGQHIELWQEKQHLSKLEAGVKYVKLAQLVALGVYPVQ